MEKVKLELSILGSNHENWKEVIDLLKSIKNDPSLETEASYKVLIKIYTHESVFRHVTEAMHNGEFYKIQTYLACVI